MENYSKDQHTIIWKKEPDVKPSYAFKLDVPQNFIDSINKCNNIMPNEAVMIMFTDYKRGFYVDLIKQMFDEPPSYLNVYERLQKRINPDDSRVHEHLYWDKKIYLGMILILPIPGGFRFKFVPYLRKDVEN